MGRAPPDGSVRGGCTGDRIAGSGREFLETVPNLCLEKPIGIAALRAVVNERLR